MQEKSENSGTIPKVQKRCAVVVFGMHRSGTSALARMLGLMGCTLPATLVPANKTNPAGHWESQPICDFDDEVFAAAGTHWLDWLPLNPEFSRSMVWPSLVARARSLLQSEFGMAPLFAIKDPRMCRLADLWLEALDAEGVEPVIVLALRHPFEVSTSLTVGGYPVGEGYGHVLWLRHLLSAEASTRGRRRTVVTFDMLMTNWEAVAERLTVQLGVHWPRRTQLTSNEVDSFLTPSLRHHKNPGQAAGSRLPSWVAETYAILHRWAEQGETPEDYQALDALLKAFDAAAPVFARPLIASTEAQREAQGLRVELEIMAQGRDEAVTERDAALATANAVLNGFDAERLTLNEQIAAERAKYEGLNDAHQQVAELQHRLAFAQSQSIQREEQLAQIEAERATERAELDVLQGAVAQAKGEITRLTERLAEADKEVCRLSGEHKAATAAMKRAEEKAELVADDLANARSESQRALSLADARIAAAQQDHRTVLADYQQLAQTLSETHAHWDMQTRERYREIAILTGLLRAREDDALAMAKVAEQAQANADTRILVADAEIKAALVGQHELASELAATRVAEAAHLEVAVWSGKIATELMGSPKWWALVPQPIRERWEEERLRRQGLFDADAYRAANPDVAAAGVSAVRHYLRFGLHERRTGTR